MKFVKTFAFIFICIVLLSCNNKNNVANEILPVSQRDILFKERLDIITKNDNENIIIAEKLTRNINIYILNESYKVFDNYLREIIENFNNSNDKITIHILNSNEVKRVHLNPFSVSDEFDGYADIVLSDCEKILEWCEMKYILPLQNFQLSLDRFHTNIMENIFIDSNICGIPIFSHKLSLLYYNKLYASNNPGSIEEISENSIENGVSEDFINFSYPLNNSRYIYPLLYETGFRQVNSLDSLIDNVNNTADFIRTIDQNKDIPFGLISYDQADYLFRNSKMAYIINGDWAINPYMEALGDNLGISAVPKLFRESENKLSFPADVKYLFVSRTIIDKPERLLAAKKVLEYLSSIEVQLSIMRNTQFTSPIRDIALNMSDSDIKQKFLNEKAKALYYSKLFNDYEKKRLIYNIIDKYLKPLFDKPKTYLSKDIISNKDLSIIEKYYGAEN